MNRQTDDGRTIGNGVVIGFVAAIASITALALAHIVASFVALSAIIGLFVVLFGGDMWIQHEDMQHDAPSVPNVDAESLPDSSD